MRGEHGGLLAVVRAGRHPNRARSDIGAPALPDRALVLRRGEIELDVAGALDMRRPEGAEALGVGVALRGDQRHP